MRIVAGTARGRRLGVPAGDGTRPTSDKVRGAIFNVLGQFFDRDVRFDAPHVGLAQHELVERDVPRGGQDDVLGKFRHHIFSTTGAGSHSPDLTPRHPSTFSPFPLLLS